jgi:hypothetical protein
VGKDEEISPKRLVAVKQANNFCLFYNKYYSFYNERNEKFTMKKLFRRTLSIIFAAMFAMLVPMSAFATSTPDTTSDAQTVTSTVTSDVVVKTGTANDVLNLYKVIKISLSDTKVLQYELVDTFEAYLKTTTNYANYKASDFMSDKITETVLKDILGGYTAYVKTTSNNVSADATATTNSDGDATFTGVSMGQYIVVGSGNTTSTKIYQTTTAKVAPTAIDGTYKLYKKFEVQMKTNTPTIAKTVTSTNVGEEDDVLSATVGDSVTFQLNIGTPTFPEGATNKTFFVADTPSAGITLDVSSVVVKDKNDNTLTKNTDYKVSYENGKLYIDFVYDNVKSLDRVFVTYSGVLNNLAVVGGNGNTNSAQLVYSNNPYSGSTYDPDSTDPRPDPNNGYASASSSVTLYTYGLVIEKYTKGSAGSLKLQGAEFEIHMKSDCSDDAIATITSGADGLATFAGLRAGFYYLKETKTPAGYTALADPVTVEVGADESTAGYSYTTTTTYTSDSTKALYGVQATDENGNLLYFATEDAKTTTTTKSNYPAYVETVTTTSTANDDSTAKFSFVQVENFAGVDLPGTGGIGIVPFIAIGSILMIGTAVVLITRRRMTKLDAQD